MHGIRQHGRSPAGISSITTMRSIIHLDADAFFASVEQASDTRLRGKPVAIGSRHRGVITSASYEAQASGIRLRMPVSQAKRRCANLVVLPGNFEKYEQFSQWMFAYVHDFTPAVEVISPGAGYCDVSGARRNPQDIATDLRRIIGNSLKISVSEGLATSKLVSSIASRLHKPGTFLEVKPGTEADFLAPLPAHWLPGLASPVLDRLRMGGLTHIGQIARTPPHFLAMLVGENASRLRQFALGDDPRPLNECLHTPATYRRREAFASDTTSFPHICSALYRLADELTAELRMDRRLIRTVTLRIRYNDEEEQARSITLHEPTDIADELYTRLQALLKETWQRRVSIRMITLTFSNVYATSARNELRLGGATARYDSRRRLANAVRELQETFGSSCIGRGHALQPLRTQAPPPCNSKKQAAQLSYRQAGSRHSAGSPTARPAVCSLLHVHSTYSFLDSLLSIPDIVDLALRQGLTSVALTDTGNLHGAVAFVQAAQAAGIQPILGVEMTFNGRPLLLYAENRNGYANLCKLLGNADRIERGAGPGTQLTAQHLAGLDTSGIIAIGATADPRSFFEGSFYLGVSDPRRLDRNRPQDIPVVASPRVHYAAPSDRQAFEVMQSIRTLTLAGHPHPGKHRGHLHAPTPGELQQRFRALPEALFNIRTITERCRNPLELGTLHFPRYRPRGGESPESFLLSLVTEGARRRYGSRSGRVMPGIREELSIISEVGYAEYFLLVWDLLQECRRRNIRWITRGSAADSLVCYCLEISDICPVRFDLYFRRFLNRERMQMKKLPDIDIDFAHDEKDTVVRMIFEKYGTAHTAAVGGFNTYRARSALADIAKVLGIPESRIRKITKRIPVMEPSELRDLNKHVQCRDFPTWEEPMKSAFELAMRLDGVPRNPKMHPCGIVVSQVPLHQITPCFRSAKGYPTTHFDMDAVEAAGLVKLDILAQGGLATLRDTENLLKRRSITLNLTTLEPWQDPAVWDMISSGNARAVHHIESPAMLSLCKMCNIHDIDTLVAVVSVIRPGAANEKKKFHFTQRYQGLEPVTYPHPSLEACLKTTFGMVVYEEQVLQICEYFAGMPPGESDALRRALNKENWHEVTRLGERFAACAHEQGRDIRSIQNVWKLICGFHGFSFCKAHSAAYAVEAYQAAWLKLNYPAEFMAAVLSNGKGFYPALVYSLECHLLGITLLPPHVLHPGPGFCTEGNAAVRVPLSAINGLRCRTVRRIEQAARERSFASLDDFFSRIHPDRQDTQRLINIGALDGNWQNSRLPGPSRSTLFWEIENLHRQNPDNSGQAPLHNSLLDGQTGYARAPGIPRTEPTRIERLNTEYAMLGYTVTGHPLDQFPDIRWETYCPLGELHRHPGRSVTCCGLIVASRVIYHRRGEQMKFLTLADYTGIVEAEMFARV